MQGKEEAADQTETHPCDGPNKSNLVWAGPCMSTPECVPTVNNTVIS